MIKLIINADDFGHSRVFNEKILELLERGFIKSTTVMVNRVAPGQESQLKKLALLRKTKKVSVGLHLELDASHPIESQIESQRKKFVSLFGFEPSHLDIHKPQLLTTQAIKEVFEYSEKHGFPIRNHEIESGAKTTSHCFGIMLGREERLDFNRLLGFAKSLKDGESGEIVSHPGAYDPACKSSLNKERQTEFENIVKLQDFLRSRPDIKNISYLEL